MLALRLLGHIHAYARTFLVNKTGKAFQNSTTTGLSNPLTALSKEPAGISTTYSYQTNHSGLCPFACAV